MMMISVAILIGLTGALSPATAMTWEATPVPASAEGSAQAQEMRAINRSLQEIVSLLKDQARRQQTDLLMKRMETYHRALAAQEQELRRATSDRNSLTQELRGITARIEQISAESDIEKPGESRLPKEAMAQFRAEMDLQERLLKERLAVADQAILDLENDVARRRKEIAVWEEMVDTQLGLR